MQLQEITSIIIHHPITLPWQQSDGKFTIIYGTIYPNTGLGTLIAKIWN
jgi:hypothetical protein